MLKDECHNEQEVNYVKEWFRNVYVKAEDRAIETWIKGLERYRLYPDNEGKEVDFDELEELLYFNRFLERIWYKYHYNLMKQISMKFRPKTKFKNLEETDPFFEDTPESILFNVNEYQMFEDFVSSDLFIETLR